MTTNKPQLGWIGLGRIGLPMASQLLADGHELLVCDTSSEAVRMGTEQGAAAAATPKDIAAQTEICFLCLPGEDAIEKVVFGADGLAAAPSENLIIVDHSTIAPDRCREFAARAQDQAGMRWVDMPISGGVTGARDGRLIAWAGGAAQDIEGVRPLVSSYIVKLTVMGAVGQGQLVKSCNQMIVCGTVALWSEMMRYAAAAGLDPKHVIAILDGGATDSRVRGRFAPELAAHAVPEQSIRNMKKDLSVVLSHAATLGFSSPLTEAALEEFESHIGSSCS